jgi:hypothetical protein
MGKISRNAPCPCGSGKKFKNCCLRKEVEKEKGFWFYFIIFTLIGIINVMVAILLATWRGNSSWFKVGAILFMATVAALASIIIYYIYRFFSE